MITGAIIAVVSFVLGALVFRNNEAQANKIVDKIKAILDAKGIKV